MWGRGNVVEKVVQRLIKIIGADFSTVMDSFMIVISKTDHESTNFNFLIKELTEVK
jgi:hypothetical protein